jgi:glycosyltransferase involved in cell wall biosynthesis
MARRNGIAKAMGDYYLFLDSDDYWDSDLLETINKAIEDYGCDMVIFNYKKITPIDIYRNKPVFENGALFDKENKEQIFEEIIKGSRLNNLWTKAVKCSIVDYEDYSKYKRVKNAEDLLQSLPLLSKAKRIMYLDKTMYNYRMNPTSITHSFNIQSLNDITMVRGVVLNYMELLGMNEIKYLKLFYQNYVTSVLTYLFDLSNSLLPTNEKKYIMNQIQNISLYKNAFPYLEGSSFTWMQKLQLYLFKKKFYKLLIRYEKVIKFIKLRFMPLL